MAERNSEDSSLIQDNNHQMRFTIENLINAYQNETELWNTSLNASEDNKSLAWLRLSQLFNMTVGKLLCI